MRRELLQAAELQFRTYLHTVMPLHESLVDVMCAEKAPPLELATVLEDIGQRYVALAERLNRALIRTGRLDDEPDADDAAETQMDEFAERLIDDAGIVSFKDGIHVEAGEALRAYPFVAGAIRAALLLARAEADDAQMLRLSQT